MTFYELPELPDDYRYGLIVRGAFLDWGVINKKYACRHCGGRLNGKPYACPETGELDHNRYVCGGADEHQIIEEGDIIPKGQLEWQENKERLEAEGLVIDFRKAGLEFNGVPQLATPLYPDDDFEGFE
jgi:hypothetical protein